MFNNMKNKIREKTGSELPKFAPSSNMFAKSRSNQHSRQNSQGSINSITSDQGSREESETRSFNSSLNNTKLTSSSNSQPSEEESPIKTPNWESRLAEKEKEWTEKEKSYLADLLKQTKELGEALAQVEENKKKFLCCQEEKEQLELYQKQEVSKIKELLLVKEEEINSNVTALKNALALADSLKQDVSRLAPLEEKINNCQRSSETNDEDDAKLKELTTRLEVRSKENEALRLSNEESRRILDESLCKEIAKNNELNVEIVKLKACAQEFAIALDEEKKVKDETLLRNAEISQKVQLTNQELHEQQNQNEELFKRVGILEEELEQSKQTLEKLQSKKTTAKEELLEEKIRELENEMNDKNKSIRILQQNLADVKKTFQSELKNNLQANKSNNSGSIPLEEDINFKYMKHVLIKFLTSSEYEAQQLTKAVATLLKLSSEEERLIRETLDWRTSWFGSKPRVKLHSNPS